MVLPSSALRSCTAVKRTSSLPHLGHVSLIVASVFTLALSTAWTLDCSFCRNWDGKSEGFVWVTIVLEPFGVRATNTPAAVNLPLLSAPQQSQVRMFFSVPMDAGSKLPQS
ncbi:hypothetical protein ColKHC_09537 [Colletotrichum higginsianum]|nr:hypothetical protein ColKHC_09537 [Colletotrichum higginsianum]